MGASTEAENLPTALVVDDEKEVADAYALRLRELCTVDTVYNGRDALTALDESGVDVVLLDRHMPGMSGDDVLSALEEREFDGRVIMVTAIDPAFDVLEMPFDDYLCKPIDRDDLRTAVRQQCRILGYETLGEYFRIESKVAVLEAELPEAELAEHTAYQERTQRATGLERRVRRLLDDPDPLFQRFDAIEREGR